MEPVTSVMVGEAVAGQGKKLCKQAEGIINSLETNQYDLGEILMNIQDNQSYIQRGFNTYAEYMKTTKLKVTKSRYLPQIARVMKTIGVARSQYENIGISKLRIIASLNPTDTFKHPQTGEEASMYNYIVEIVDKAITDGEAYTLDEIKKHVRILKGVTGGRDITFFGIAILRTARDYVVIPALERAKALIGSVAKDEDGKSIDASDGIALERICAEFLAIPNDHFLVPDEGSSEAVGEGE